MGRRRRKMRKGRVQVQKLSAKTKITRSWGHVTFSHSTVSFCLCWTFATKHKFWSCFSSLWGPLSWQELYSRPLVDSNKGHSVYPVHPTTPCMHLFFYQPLLLFSLLILKAVKKYKLRKCICRAVIYFYSDWLLHLWKSAVQRHSCSQWLQNVSTFHAFFYLFSFFFMVIWGFSI